MNRNRYRLVFNRSTGLMTPVAETARRMAHGGAALITVAGAGALIAVGAAQAELPVSAGGANPAHVIDGSRLLVNQTQANAIHNWQSFNISAGSEVRFQQVDGLATQNLVPGARFTSLNRIFDLNPSVIAGQITQGAGQHANVILVNANGIAFMGGSQVNLASFTASSLDIADSFIFGSLLTNDSNPQFVGNGGFIKVFEGARITAGSQGRVMLLAPTVVNHGTVAAPDGQIIAAAGSRVFLSAAGNTDPNVRGLLVEVDSPDELIDFDTPNPAVRDGVLDGQPVNLTDALTGAATDRLGHVTNTGTLTTPRGNVTMIGYAVNQHGIARATTSVITNGSVYLLAKDEAVSKTQATRGGRVIVGANSLTEVTPDTADETTALDADSGQGLARSSQVQVLGQTISVETAATIRAPSGNVTLTALDNPGQLNQPGGNPFTSLGIAASSQASITVASRARIDVAGLENVEVSAARNAVEVELRGDELKDAPANRSGALRGEKVFLDVNRALANSDAGLDTLIARDSLESYQARLERGVAERSTTGGTVNIASQGTANLTAGAVIDLSGGSVEYTAAEVRTTLLTNNGVLTDLADADATTRYDGIASRYVVDYGRWNRSRVIDLGQSLRFDPGYVEGRDAGALSVVGMAGVALAADVQGRTTTGERQRAAALAPTGATLTLGSAAVAGDYKLNQRVILGTPGSDDIGALALDPGLLGDDRIANFKLFSNQAVEVRAALRAAHGGSVEITGKGITVKADIDAPAGVIALNARGNTVDPGGALDVQIDSGVTLAARGGWRNDLVDAPTSRAPGKDGGAVSVSAAGDVVLAAGALIDVTGGGRVRADGKLDAGDGGDVRLEVGAGIGASSAHAQQVTLAGELRGHGLGRGGAVSVNTRAIRLGDTAPVADGVLALAPEFFTHGGFADFDLTGRDGLTVAADTTLAPRVESLDVHADYRLQPGASRVETFSTRIVRDDRVRPSANLTLAADSSQFGVVAIERGARIDADDGARVSLAAGSRVDIQGEIHAAGGAISATLSRSLNDNAFDARNAIWLGDAAVLDASGAARTYLDSHGRRVGELLDGGSVSLTAQSGYVVTQAGSRVSVNGAAPVLLDLPNPQGGLGRTLASDAGTFKVRAREGVVLDGTWEAQAGNSATRGGSFELVLVLGDNNAQQAAGYPTGERVVSLAPTVAAAATGLASGDAIPDTFNGRAVLDAGRLEAAGFDRVRVQSRAAIRLEDGVALGAARAVASDGLRLREIALDAPRLETAGGDANLTAHTIRLGNTDADNQAASNTPVSGSGTLRADAQLLELVGKQTLTGMANAELTGRDEIRLSGVITSPTRPTGELRTAADLTLTAARVAPSPYVDYTLDASGKTLTIRQTGIAAQPLAALGALAFKAADIVQGGTIWAPLGSIDFAASGTLSFLPGSLSSVAAAPGSVLPFGKVENGRRLFIGIASGQQTIDALPEKAIRTAGARVDMQAGAVLDAAGGGALQAYEFTVGPGGSADILAAPGTYAVLPGYGSGFAPADAQEGFDRASGEAVYLADVPGLADGVYTLLPAHYALLPGAYAVRLDTGVRDLFPGRGYVQQDGVRIAAGYVTDSRAGLNSEGLNPDGGNPAAPNALAPGRNDWQGIAVLTREQVRERSEFTLASAADFSAINRPQDAGRLAITTGLGANALTLAADTRFEAAAGGRAALLDLAATRLAVVGDESDPTELDPDTVRVKASQLNRLGAASVFLGGTRVVARDATTLSVTAEVLTLANDAASALAAPEIVLAARDTLDLRAGSRVVADGPVSDAGQPASVYETSGEGAFVRVASSAASLTRSDVPATPRGTLTGAADLVASDAITLDATRSNAFSGTTGFRRGGVAVAGRLTVGAERINFGDAPTGSEGLSLREADLAGLAALDSLTLTSYSRFDLYGDVSVGALDAAGKPVLNRLTLNGAGLAGFNTAGQTAQLNAKNLTLANPNKAASFAADSAPGIGSLAITADTLSLGQGDKAIAGFDAVRVTANALVAAAGTGTLAVNAPLTLDVARLSGEQAAEQTLNSSGVLSAAQHTADRVLAPVAALGAAWAFQGSAVDFDTHLELPSGSARFTATNGDVTLGANARVDLAGRRVGFFDVAVASPGGTVRFESAQGDVDLLAGAQVDVSAAAGGDAGGLDFRAVDGRVNLASNVLVAATPADAAGRIGAAATAHIDAGELANFSELNAALNAGKIDGERAFRARSGDIRVAAGDTVRAQVIDLAADDGSLVVAGTLTTGGATATDGGRVSLFAGQDVKLEASARLSAAATATDGDGGRVELGARDGELDLAAGSRIDVSGGQGGSLLLRALRTAGDVAVTALDSVVVGARERVLEAVRAYDGVTTLNATGASDGTTLTLATVNADNAAFALNHDAIKRRLDPAGDGLQIVSGVEVRAPGELTLAQDWNLKDSRAGGTPGTLTLRAGGDLHLNANLSDGFSHATPFSTGTTPATLLADASWTYRLVGGADEAAANPLAVKPGAGDVTLAAGKLVRTGTGDIAIAAGGDIRLADTRAVVYTAGRAAQVLTGFTNPANAQFSEDGGNVDLAAAGNIVGTPSAQLYSNWLFRQGRVAADGASYTTLPAWWVRFDQFQQGVAALGGGNVGVRAGGMIENVSVSTPTQARVTGTPGNAVLHRTGGGNVSLASGDDVRGGQYYADRGTLSVDAGGALTTGQTVGTGANARPLYTILALGDARADVRARGRVEVQAIVNPHLVVQSSGSGTSVNVATSASAQWSVFSTYGEASAAALTSLADDVAFYNDSTGGSRTVATLASVSGATAAYRTPLNFGISSANYKPALALGVLPSSLALTALQGSVEVGGTPSLLRPAARGGVVILARDSVALPVRLTLADMEALPDATRPAGNTNGFAPTTLTAHAATPVHRGDPEPVRVYAAQGDVSGAAGRINLNSAKAVQIRAGRDVSDFGVIAQHAGGDDTGDDGDVSRIEAGRDVRFASQTSRTDGSYVWVAGPGRLEVSAGRNVDLGTSAGIVSRGNLDNAALPDHGADIHVAAGVGANGIDYDAAIARVLARFASAAPGSTAPASVGPDSTVPDPVTLSLARWLTGDDAVTADNARAAVAAVAEADPATRQARVRDFVYTALRETGRDSLDIDSPFVADYTRGYAALEVVFPGIGAVDADGNFVNYRGEINLFASRILTERGGDIEFMAPGGGVIVGLANTPAALLATVTPGAGLGLTDSGVLGLAVAADGDIRGFARDDLLVNQSRILTVGGGDVLLWSSAGDIDAGRGKKTAVTVPPPLILVDAQGNVTQVLQGAASGSGIGALTPAGGMAGDVDLVAPRGTVNAGDAGIRAGNLNIAAQVVLGADNISVSGTSAGTPVADTSAVSAASSGASNAGNEVSDVTAALSDTLAEAARAAESLKDALKPTFISAEVIGHGD